MTAQDILARLKRPKPSGPSSWMALCPGHDDHNPSLSVSEGNDGRVLLKCFAGCPTDSIVRAMNLTMGDLMPEDRSNGNGQATPKSRQAKRTGGKHVATYTYVDEAGNDAYQVRRMEFPDGSKEFPQYRPDGKGRWIPGLAGTPRLLYHLPDTIAAAKAGHAILIVEGEKDCDRARSEGLKATTASGGAEKWPKDQSHHLTGARVIIIPDNDPPGRKHVDMVAASVAPYAEWVKVVELPGVPYKGDLSDYLDAGGTLDQLKQLVHDTPTWTPSTPEPVSVAPGDKTPPVVGIGSQDFWLTDVGNAQRLVHMHGMNLRYCFAFSKWYVWDGCRWAEDDCGEVDRRAKETVRAIYAETATVEDDATRSALAKHARKSDHAAPIAAMMKMAQSELGIPVRVDDLDQDQWLINTPTGTINLRTGELLDHRREDLITKITSTGYDPAAECPTWLKFLERVLPDPDVRAFVQRAAGYSLTGSVSEQCLFFLHGAGANGKSTMLEALRYVIGDYGQQAAPDLLILKSGDNTPTGVAALRGARFICTVEVEEGRRLAESLTKQLTGGDRINARFLYQNAFEFDMTGKIWLAANHRPGIRGTDLAIWRRVRLVPFTESIPEEERDPELLGKLKAEAAGILRWCVEGCMEWRRIGLKPPEPVKAATEEYRVEQDVIGTFIADCCVTDRVHRVKAGDLFKAYQSWCTENGERPTNQNAFGRKLEERNYRKKKQGGTIYREGIALAADTLQIDSADPFGDSEQDD